jgi:hypothetical protein
VLHCVKNGGNLFLWDVQVPGGVGAAGLSRSGGSAGLFLEAIDALALAVLE